MKQESKNGDVKTGGGIPLTIHAQYVRDISFENPMAPHALRRGLPAPKTRIQFGVDARRLEEKGLEGRFEVTLTVNAETHRDGETVFITEVQYGSTVSMEGVPEEQRHPLLFIEVPRLAFPFVRQIIYDLSIQGGYPPLLLTPVNFQQLYLERFGKEAKFSEKEEKKSGAKDKGKKTAKSKKAKG